MSPRKALAAAIMLTTAACATAPKQACTDEWVNYEVTQTFNELRHETRNELSTIKALAKALEDGQSLSRPRIALRLVGAAHALETITDVYVSKTRPELEAISQTCERPDLLIDAFTAFLREEGAPETIIGMVDDFHRLSTMEHDA